MTDVSQLLSQLGHLLLTQQTPALPDIATMRVARYVSWAICLAFFVLFLGQKWPRTYQRSAAAVVFVWTLLPGPVSPAFWLGLAFQMPSLLGTLLCLLGCVLLMHETPPAWWRPDTLDALRWAGVAGVVLGWVLMLDTFAQLPFSASVYAMGFSPMALVILLALSVLPWVLGGSAAPGRVVSYVLGTVLVLFVVLRVPTGNLWDVLLDPWLWFVLQMDLLLLALRWIKARWPGSKAIRA